MSNETQSGETSAAERPTIELSRERGGYQLAIYEPSGLGYRIAGPKFAGGGEVLHTHVLSQRDADEIRLVLDKSFPSAVSVERDALAARVAELEETRSLAFRRLEATWTAIVESWRLLGDGEPVAALDSLGDYMNGCDAVDDESIEQFERARRVASGAPERCPNVAQGHPDKQCGDTYVDNGDTVTVLCFGHWGAALGGDS